MTIKSKSSDSDSGDSPGGNTACLTDSQLAARWQCSTRFIRNLRSKGEGPEFFKIGRHYRSRLDSVIDYENGGEA